MKRPLLSSLLVNVAVYPPIVIVGSSNNSSSTRSSTNKSRPSPITWRFSSSSAFKVYNQTTLGACLSYITLPYLSVSTIRFSSISNSLPAASLTPVISNVIASPFSKFISSLIVTNASHL